MEMGMRSSVRLPVHRMLVVYGSDADPRHTARRMRQGHEALATSASAACCASTLSHSDRLGSRPLSVFHCTAGREGVKAQLTIVSQGTGRSSNKPWQNSSTHTRTAKSRRAHQDHELSVDRRKRRTVSSRRIEAPPGVLPPRWLQEGSTSGKSLEVTGM
eukprot:scaffold8848_cov101-Isochrysis_galbana.AAC.2